MKDLGSNEYKWWAWVDLNYRPHAYQACALTGLSYRPAPFGDAPKRDVHGRDAKAAALPETEGRVSEVRMTTEPPLALAFVSEIKKLISDL